MKVLNLPGPSRIGGGPDPIAAIHDHAVCKQGSQSLGTGCSSKVGFVGLVTLCSVPFGSDGPFDATINRQNLLIPVLKDLKELELQCDQVHPGSPFAMSKYSTDIRRLPAAIQTLKLVESLKIGYSNPSIRLPPEFLVPIPPSLYQTLLLTPDDFDEEDYDDDDDDDPAGAPPGQMPTPMDFLGYLASIVSQTTPAPQLPPDTSTGGSGQQSLATAPTQSQIQPCPIHSTAHIGANGSQNMTADFALDMKAAVPKPNPTDEPLNPNPWPNLKYLSIWVMPATKADVVRLIKTIAGSLESLEMYEICFSSGDHHSSNDPVYTQDLQNHLSSATGSAGAIITSVLGPTVSASESEESAISNVDQKALAEKDEWYDTIEMMADILRLKSCTIVFEKLDKLRLQSKLNAQVEGLMESDVNLDVVVAEYIVHGNGMGLALFVAAAVMKDTESKQYHRDDKSDTAFLSWASKVPQQRPLEDLDLELGPFGAVDDEIWSDSIEQMKSGNDDDAGEVDDVRRQKGKGKAKTKESWS